MLSKREPQIITDSQKFEEVAELDSLSMSQFVQHD